MSINKAWLGPLVCLCLARPAMADGDFTAAEPPDAPATIETAYTGPTSVTVYWSPPVTPGFTGYRLFRNDTLIAAPRASSRLWVDPSLQPGGVYHYRVQADYADGHSASSHTIAEKLPPSFTRMRRYDVVVVDGSSAGVAAAVTAARKGLHVALLEPTDRLGGIMSSGLCSTDMRRPAHSTGFFEEFRQRIQDYYGSGEGLRYEPHVVNNVLKGMVAAEVNLDVFFHVRATGVVLRHGEVVGVRTQGPAKSERSVFLAPLTIDADPTGDVTAWSGCRCRVGREARSREEPHAGVIYYWRAKDTLLPGSTGRADHRLMAYTYLCVVKDYGPGTDHRIPPPPGYKVSDYIHSPSWKDSWAYTSGAMPGGKYELNQHPQGNDLQGINYRWPWESQPQRAETELAYRNHTLGYLYYLQTHDNLPNLGLPDDEFPENGGFPETLYVREARRVVGMANLTEHDVTLAGERLRPDSAGIGDYPMDSHAVRPKVNWATADMGEGEYWLYRYTPWYQIPVGVVIPKDRDGLLVAEAVSATHVGYGTLRMEPVRMEMGELCGNLAALSRLTGVRPRNLPLDIVQDALMQAGQRIFWHADVPATESDAAAIQYLAAHGFWPDKEFKPDAVTTRGEAYNALRQLQWMEAAQSGQPALLKRVRASQWASPDHPEDPVTRGTFAQWLVQAEATLRPKEWDTRTVAASFPSLPYYDLEPGTAVTLAALVLWQHSIHTDDWKSGQVGSYGIPLFEADKPLLHSELAQALYLAQRTFPSPFYMEIEAIVGNKKLRPVRVP